MTDVHLLTAPGEIWRKDDLPPPERKGQQHVDEIYVKGLGRVRRYFDAFFQSRRSFPPFWKLMRAELLEPCPAGEEPDQTRTYQSTSIMAQVKGPGC